MPNDPAIHHRRSIRLQGYDYSQAGAYYVTIVTKERACIFGGITNHEIHLSSCGQIARWQWVDLPHHNPLIELDEFCIMPNHIHGIIVIVKDMQQALSYKPRSIVLPEIIRGYKTFSARKINELRKTPGLPVWQRNYYEHIIRNEFDLERIRGYIKENCLNWSPDEEEMVS